jgi:hypothetical protein
MNTVPATNMRPLPTVSVAITQTEPAGITSASFAITSPVVFFELMDLVVEWPFTSRSEAEAALTVHPE